MKKSKKLIISTGLTLALLISGGVAQAVNSNFNVTVSKFNGSATTPWIAKPDGVKESIVFINGVGGDYKVDMRVQSHKTSTDFYKNWAWIKQVDERDTYSYKTLMTGRERIEFSNNLFTPVNVQVHGVHDTAWR